MCPETWIYLRCSDIGTISTTVSEHNVTVLVLINKETLTNLGLGHHCGLSITEWRERQTEFCFFVPLETQRLPRLKPFHIETSHIWLLQTAFAPQKCFIFSTDLSRERWDAEQRGNSLQQSYLSAIHIPRHTGSRGKQPQQQKHWWRAQCGLIMEDVKAMWNQLSVCPPCWHLQITNVLFISALFSKRGTALHFNLVICHGVIFENDKERTACN